MDLRQFLLRLEKNGVFVDRTDDVVTVMPMGDKHLVTFADGGRYSYGPDRVDLRAGREEPLVGPCRVMVQDVWWPSARHVVRFGDLTRAAFETGGRLVWKLYPTDGVVVVAHQPLTGDAAAIWEAWGRAVRALPADDPTRRAFERIDFIHPDSALAAYLDGGGARAIEAHEGIAAIHPFASNISQRRAVETALGHTLSVIQGPPGTGKTQTILNILASVVAHGAGRAGLVSFTNSAVANVREKLDDLGVGVVAASLGNKEITEAFVMGQVERNAAVDALVAAHRHDQPHRPGGWESLSDALKAAQEIERQLARCTTELAAWELERQHFLLLLERQEPPPLADYPLLQRSSDLIVRFLAETAVDPEPSGLSGLLRRVRRYVRYGSTKGLDAQDADVVLRLQERVYAQRIAELGKLRSRLDEQLAGVDLPRLVEEHAEASRAVLWQALVARYGGLPRALHAKDAWRRDRRFGEDYPVVLSTCHSLAGSLRTGELLDLLVIDEASQVDVISAALALACARRVVIVGDEQQLPPITPEVGDVLPVSSRAHPALSLMASVRLAGGGAPPTVPLIEHYRCDPVIIDYCNRSFYGGELVTLSRRGHEHPMEVVVTTPGRHQRLHRGGGITNQREIDVILREVLPGLQASDREVASIVTPYRRQADTLAERVGAGAADTVHRFQGRERDVIVMSTVIDDSWRGVWQQRFVDDARLINVAVSRARRRFILVTHDSLHPGTRHLAELIGYIRYQSLDDTFRVSTVFSVFDLLYRDHTAQLIPLAKRLKSVSRYKSENIAWTVLLDVLATLEGVLDSREFHALVPTPQCMLRNLVPDSLDLTDEERAYIGNRASLDMVVHHKVSRRVVLAIEVNGFQFHENDVVQQGRDRLKASICAKAGIPLLTLRTTDSDEPRRVRQALAASLGLAGEEA